MAKRKTEAQREAPGPPAEEVSVEPGDGTVQGDDQPEPVAETPPGSDLVLSTDLSVYPVREPSEDPRWAVRTVKGWVWFTLFCLGFILVLLVLGLFYD